MRTEHQLTHTQAALSKAHTQTEAYLKGYSRGWLMQPENPPEAYSEKEKAEYMEGHTDGWNHRAADQN